MRTRRPSSTTFSRALAERVQLRYPALPHAIVGENGHRIKWRELQPKLMAASSQSSTAF